MTIIRFFWCVIFMYQSKLSKKPCQSQNHPHLMSLPTLYQHYTSGGISSGLSASQPYFTLNNRNITIYSGAVHYFRVPRPYWRDRLRKMRAAGLNTIETYVPWNLHEPQDGVYDFGNCGNSDFGEMLDLRGFLEAAQKEDLFAIVRPGPYICGEWEFGGLPSWLLRNTRIRLRSSDKSFTYFVERYFRMLLPILALLQFTKGGPVIAMQIENEFGSLRRKDMRYLKQLKSIFRRNGIEELLFTSDGPSAGNVGQMPGTLFTGNFQSEPHLELNILQSYQPGKPLMVMEYWTGWFDHWGESHSKVEEDDYIYTLRVILQFPASVNLYMFHGGTNFGFMNGANLQNRKLDNEGYQPDTTSYDYDAPLTENGDYTPKYFRTKKLLKRYNSVRTMLPKMPKEKPRFKYGTLEITEQLVLEDLIAQIPFRIKSRSLLPMEFLPINNNSGQSYGYIIYRKENIHIPSNSKLTILGRVCDTVMLLIDGVLKSKVLETYSDLYGFGYWKQKNAFITIETEYINATLDLVVENWGRVNFGSFLQYKQYKGLWQGDVLLNNRVINDWILIPLEFKKAWTLSLKNWKLPKFHVGPALYKTKLILNDEPMDTFVDTRDWIKGIIIVNGFVLSRYFKLGPQQTAYLPAPFLQIGVNEILIFEHFEVIDLVKFSDTQLFENLECKQDIFRKAISIFVN